MMLHSCIQSNEYYLTEREAFLIFEAHFDHDWASIVQAQIEPLTLRLEFDQDSILDLTESVFMSGDLKGLSDQEGLYHFLMSLESY